MYTKNSLIVDIVFHLFLSKNFFAAQNAAGDKLFLLDSKDVKKFNDFFVNRFEVFESSLKAKIVKASGEEIDKFFCSFHS